MFAYSLAKKLAYKFIHLKFAFSFPFSFCSSWEGVGDGVIIPHLSSSPIKSEQVKLKKVNI